jgi:hypothetical protein
MKNDFDSRVRENSSAARTDFEDPNIFELLVEPLLLASTRIVFTLRSPEG